MRLINLKRTSGLVCLLTLFSLWALPTASAYKLTYFYDPETGNVAFDTSETRSGETLTYHLRLHPEYTPIRFRPENLIALTNSQLQLAKEEVIEEITLSNPMRGYLTVGDVLPTGLAEEQWQTLFTDPTGSSVYAPGLGLPGNENITFVYGQPDRDFDNRWDLIDPDTLEWATAATLIYRESSGEVYLDTRGTNGGHISGFILESMNEFLIDNFIRPWESPFGAAVYSRISMLGDAIEPGIYSLGNIIQAGLTESEYQTLFTEAYFLGKNHMRDLDLEIEGPAFSLVYVPVPEPSSALLIATAGIVFLNRRKKTSAIAAPFR